MLYYVMLCYVMLCVLRYFLAISVVTLFSTYLTVVLFLCSEACQIKGSDII